MKFKRTGELPKIWILLAFSWQHQRELIISPNFASGQPDFAKDSFINDYHHGGLAWEFLGWSIKEASLHVQACESCQLLNVPRQHLQHWNLLNAWCSDPHGEFVGKNVLIDLSQASLEEEEALSEARRKLHIHRANRPRPHLDDKVDLRSLIMAYHM